MVKTKKFIYFLGWYFCDCAMLFLPTIITYTTPGRIGVSLALLTILVMLGVNIGLRIHYHAHSHMKSALDGLILANGLQIFMFGNVLIQLL